MTRVKTTAIAALFITSVVASGAEAHAHLTGADPKAEAHMKGFPTAIRASFSEPLVAAFSGLDLSRNGARSRSAQLQQILHHSLDVALAQQSALAIGGHLGDVVSFQLAGADAVKDGALDLIDAAVAVEPVGSDTWRNAWRTGAFPA